MKALCWYGKEDVRVETVPDPKILNPRDIIVKVTTSGICGSDLHLYHGFIPTMQSGDILGHEFMGEVVEKGAAIRNLNIGDRIVVPFPIGCGNCRFCKADKWALCDNSNPNGYLASKLYGYAPAAVFGYSHLLGGYAGGQAEYVRVPFADVGHIKVPSEIPDDMALPLSDIFPTGYMAAENCDITPGQTIAVWGCGPVGQFAIKSALMLGADQVIAIDRFEDRLALAEENGDQVRTINYEEVPVIETLREMTGGDGPDSCIDAVGLEAHGHGLLPMYDNLKQKLMLETDRPVALREAIQACRKGGNVSVPGVYGGFIDKFPMGAAFSKGLTFKMGQTHVHKYLKPLLERIQNGDIDPSFVITHRVQLEDASQAYRTFKHKHDHCEKVVLKVA